MSAQAPGLAVEDLQIHYGSTVAVSGVDFSVTRGEVLAIVGPSGCGKTSVLRAVAGLTTPAAGSVSIGGRTITSLAPARRAIGLVPQSYAIFPHMSVRGNIEYGLKARHVPREERARRSDDVLSLVQMSQYADRQPSALSGGQRQRVALARALAIDPEVLLLDEPLSALDPQLRTGLRRSLSSSLSKVGCTTVIVTHDQQEALALAHTIAVMRDGRIEQYGTPGELWNAPANEFVADFLGSGRMLAVREVPGGVEACDGAWFIPNAALDRSRTRTGNHVLIQKRSLTVTDDTTDPGSAGPRDGETPAAVTHAEFAGDSTRLRLTLHGVEVDIEQSGPTSVGSRVRVTPRPEGIVLL